MNISDNVELTSLCHTLSDPLAQYVRWLRLMDIDICILALNYAIYLNF